MILRDWKTKKNVVIDSGALEDFFLLLLEDSKRRHAKEHFILLSDFLKHKIIHVIPQVFAELYSLLKRDAQSKGKLIHWLYQLIQYFEAKSKILEDESFLQFGFTDIGLSKIMKKDWVLLSNDYPFVNLCNSRGLEAHHVEEILFL